MRLQHAVTAHDGVTGGGDPFKLIDMAVSSADTIMIAAFVVVWRGAGGTAIGAAAPRQDARCPWPTRDPDVSRAAWQP